MLMKRLVLSLVVMICCLGLSRTASAAVQTFELNQPVAPLNNQLPEEARLLVKMQLKHQLRENVTDYLAGIPGFANLDRQSQLLPMEILLFPMEVLELNEGHAIKVKILVDTNRLPQNPAAYIKDNTAALDTVYRHMQSYQALVQDYTNYMQRLQIAHPQDAIRMQMSEGKQLENRITATDLFLQGCEAIGLDRWSAAESLLTQAIALAPDYNLAYFMRGIARMHIETYDKAIDDFNQDLRLAPQNGMSYFMRGIAYTIQAALPDRAISDLSKAIELDPNNGQAFYLRGLNYAHTHHCDKAQTDFSKGCSLGYGKACHKECRYEPQLESFKDFGH